MTILTLGAHPSLEKTFAIPGFETGRAYRIREAVVTAGSKGFNFARGVRTMGGQAVVVTPLAGHTGHRVSELAAAEGLACAEVWVPGETRQVINLVNPETGENTELIENGPAIGPAEWGKILTCLEAYLPQARCVAVCGSLLPGTPVDALAQVMAAANRAGVPVMLDTYGPPLEPALPLKPALLKVNHREAGDLLGRDIRTPEDALQAAQDITRLGPAAVVISMAALGAGGVDAGGETFGWRAPAVKSLSAVGSGDAMLAGLVVKWLAGAPLREAVRWGVAAGAANTLVLGPGIFHRQDAARLYADIEAW